MTGKILVIICHSFSIYSGLQTCYSCSERALQCTKNEVYMCTTCIEPFDCGDSKFWQESFQIISLTRSEVSPS